MAAALALALVVGAAALFIRVRGPDAAPRLALDPAALAPPLPPPPPPWTPAQLRDLAAAAERADREGLRSSDYDLDALRDAADAGRTDPATAAAADKAALALALDYAGGAVHNRHRFNWYIDYAGPDRAALASAIVAARQEGRLADWLTGLLPDSRQYRALRTALAVTPDDEAERRDRIRANMERWRWLPRDFGKGDQLYVNLPTYRLQVRRDGDATSSYRAVIGATDMPTPVLSADVRQVIVNPDWIVPMSIVRKSHLKPSSRYSFTRRPDGTLRVRQKPGAGNALGKVKIELPNKLAIYFHDTPSRSLFGADARAFSHGCVRVQGIETLAGTLVGDPERYRAALAGTQTRSFPVAQRWRANIVYLTLVPGEDGTLADVGDPYGMDEPLAAALDHRKPRVAAPPPLPAAEAKAGPAPGMATARDVDKAAPPLSGEAAAALLRQRPR